MGEEAIVGGPEVHQEIPVNVAEALEIDQPGLIIAREGEAALQGGAHEALMVVGGRVKQMAEDLFPGPLLFTGTGGGVGVVQLEKQRLGLGHGAAEIGSDGGKGGHGNCQNRRNCQDWQLKIERYEVLPDIRSPDLPITCDHPISYSIPNSFHFLSTSARVFSSIRISSGQGRVKPSAGHLRVASIPILEPKLGRREA